uniref:SAM domain-containing protein n=1 Tax=Castor canadensis TaxID=51338 RepID=A0A8C0XPN7_CASCN
MEAAAAGHEIIVQCFLNHGVEVDMRDHSGATARMLAKQYGHMKIVALMDTHSPALPKTPYRSPAEKYEDLSSSDESCPGPQRHRPCRKRGLSIHEGPRALARITAIGLGGKTPPPGYEEPTFCVSLGAVRSSSSSEGLTRAQGLSSEASLESNEDSDHTRKSSVRKQTKSYMKTKNRYSNSDSQWPPSTGTVGAACSPGSVPQVERPPYSGPQDLAELLEQIGCLKYLQLFEEQDVDLRIFLTLTESDLKEIGITLFGPKRKMTSAIARWHSSARPPSDALELAYADRLEAEMQELAIQLHKRCEEVEAMRGQVSQEQELRAVVESCLLEQDGARKDIQAQLQETWALAQGAALVLEQLRACQAELSARVRQDPNTATWNPALPPADSKGWHVSLRARSLPELSEALEDRVREMGESSGGLASAPSWALDFSGREEEGLARVPGHCGTGPTLSAQTPGQSHLSSGNSCSRSLIPSAQPPSFPLLGRALTTCHVLRAHADFSDPEPGEAAGTEREGEVAGAIVRRVGE